jgi:hypothetical protein
METYNLTYDVAKDGSSTETVESKIFVQGEDGKHSASLFGIDYNATTDEVSVLEAYTLNGKTKFPVEPSMIEDRDKGNSKDYDAMKSRSLAFPQVQVGSRIYVRYQIHTKKPILPERWMGELDLGPGGFMDNVHVLVHSELPIYYRVKDPGHLAWIKQKDIHSLEFRNKKAIPGWVHAEKDPYFHPDRFTHIYFSTDEDWVRFFSPLEHDVEAVLAGPLTKELESKIKSLKTVKTPEAQIYALMEYISRDYHYFGDWRRLDGGVVPRSLKEIETSRFGDCKDLSALLTAMLRALKIDARVALVRRGAMDWLEEPTYELPSLGYFNHAIVRAKVGEKTYGLDPTNPVVSTEPYSDISGRPAWVIGLKDGKSNSAFDRLPVTRSKSVVHRQEYIYEFGDDDSVRVRVKSDMEGMAPFRVANELMLESRSEVLSDVLEYLTEGNELQSHHFITEPSTTRKLGPMHVDLEYVTNRVTYVAGKDAFFVIPDGNISSFFETDNRESDLRLYDEPYVFHTVRRLKDTALKQTLPEPCKVESQWIDMSRQMVVEGSDVVIRQDVELKVPYILQSEFQSPAFKKLQKQTRECFYHSGILVGERHPQQPQKQSRVD